MNDLLEVLKPMVKNATKLVVKPSAQDITNSQWISHFGGHPYFENREKWPETKSGEKLSFIFQVYNADNICLPDEIQLVQFFYDFSLSPWNSFDDGWQVRTYSTLDKQENITIEGPRDAEQDMKFCQIDFLPVKSLPDWSGIEVHSPQAYKLACAINKEKPEECYYSALEKLNTFQDYASQLGGYPRWIQGDSIANDNKQKIKYELLFQIDSEDNASLMWGDMGMVYVQYNPDNLRNLRFELQCY